MFKVCYQASDQDISSYNCMALCGERRCKNESGEGERKTKVNYSKYNMGTKPSIALLYSLSYP